MRPKCAALAVVAVLISPVVAEAGIINLLHDRVFGSAEMWYLPPEGDGLYDAAQFSGSVFEKGVFTPRMAAAELSWSSTGPDTLDGGVNSVARLELVGDGSIALDTSGIVADSNCDDCVFESRIELDWRFQAIGTSINLNVSTDQFGLWPYADTVLFDETINQLVAEYHLTGGRHDGNIYASLVDSHVYRLLAVKGVAFPGGGEPTGSTNISFSDPSGVEINAAPVPEPATLLLIGAGVAGVAHRRRSRAIS